MFLRVALLTTVLLNSSAFADDSAPWRTVPKASGEVPEALKEVGITEHLGETVDLSLEFKNEEGQTVKLGDYFNKHKPVLLSLVYYGCPGLCSFHLNGVTDALKGLDWNMGKEFEMVVISFDPSEGPDLAQKKKSSYVEALGKPTAAAGWHFLTGSEENTKKIAAQVGFGYRWDKVSDQWAHASAINVLSPEGKITRYLYGIQFEPKTIRLSLVEAAEGRTGSVLDRLILYCFQYDPNKKSYAFYAYNIVRAGGGIVGVIMAMILIPTWLRERRKSKHQGEV